MVSELLVQNQQAPMGMFELAPVGIPIAIVGLLYVWLIGTRLIPEREDQKAQEEIGERLYQADVMVEEDGPLVGKSLADAKLTDEGRAEVVKVLRGDETVRGDKRLADLELAAGDHLIVEGKRADLLKIKDRPGLDFKADALHSDPEVDPKELTIVEGVLLPRSPLIGRSLRNLEFKERYGLQVLAIHRAGRLPKTMSSARLRLGDVLLLQGTADDVAALERGNLFNIFGGVEAARYNVSRAPLAVAIFVAGDHRRHLQAHGAAGGRAGRRLRDAADALHLAGRGLRAGRVEGPRADRRLAVAGRGDGYQRHRQVPGGPADRAGRLGRALQAADLLLPAHRRADAADVQPVGGRGGAADRHPDRRCSWASIRAALP